MEAIKFQMLLAFFCLLFFRLGLSAQDMIILQDGSEKQVKVFEVTETSVKYKNWSNIDGPLYSISKSEIFVIKYENGQKEVFSMSENTSGHNDVHAGDNNIKKVMQPRDKMWKLTFKAGAQCSLVFAEHEKEEYKGSWARFAEVAGMTFDLYLSKYGDNYVSVGLDYSAEGGKDNLSSYDVLCDYLRLNIMYGSRPRVKGLYLLLGFSFPFAVNARETDRNIPLEGFNKVGFSIRGEIGHSWKHFSIGGLVDWRPTNIVSDKKVYGHVGVGTWGISLGVVGTYHF